MKASRPSTLSPAVALGSFAAQLLVLCLFLLFTLENQPLARAFVSDWLWERLVRVLGGEVRLAADGPQADVSLIGVLMFSTLIVGAAILGAAVLRRRTSGTRFADAVSQKCVANAWWVVPLALWVALWVVNVLLSEAPLSGLLLLTSSLALSATLAGWLWEALRELISAAPASPLRDNVSNQRPSSRARGAVLCGMLVYVVVFVGMNWGLWFNLRIPHGDSAMYEEHLWNVLHGKGFRSYLDQGLFLGEHIQVIHLLLLPVYVVWPSHLFMELAESIALATTAIPVFRIARRHSGSDRAAVLLALAVLLYFPLHYLDISIDLKTFRPSAFGIPALLFAIDALERRRWGWMTFCFVLALSAQEDFAVAIAPLGLWSAIFGLTAMRGRQEGAKRQLVVGALTCVLATLYLIFAVKVAIPWFRQGDTVHYVRYFDVFGKTPTEVVWNILTKPQLLWSKFVTAGTFAYFLMLLLPIGMPLRAWDRLLVGAPLFLLLCLNELAQSTPGPVHHFHAPLIPIILWAACAAIGTRHSSQVPTTTTVQQRGLWALCCAGVTCVFFSLCPFSIEFWDPGHAMYWKRLYVPDERAREFDKIPPLIPQTARVASTDFVHPRFTHYERSYDYSDYRRRVANYEDKAPDDADYIVIDTAHPYSKIKRLEDVREIQREPDRWEVVPVETKGYYIVLKRVESQIK